MTDPLIWIIGITAGTLTTLSWVPQAVRTLRRRSADDFSWGYLSFFATGVTLWLLYGILRHDPVLIGANGLTLLLLTPVLAIKLRS